MNLKDLIRTLIKEELSSSSGESTDTASSERVTNSRIELQQKKIADEKKKLNREKIRELEKQIQLYKRNSLSTSPEQKREFRDKIKAAIELRRNLSSEMQNMR